MSVPENIDLNDPTMIFTMAGLSIFTVFATVIVTRIIRRIALRANIVDAPGGRKQHEQPVPPIGGLAIFIVLIPMLTLVGNMFSIQTPWA